MVIIFLLIFLAVFSNHSWATSGPNESSHDTTDELNVVQEKLPKWQLGAGLFYGSIPHYPASNHFYELTTPAPLFIYRFQKATLKRRELSTPINDKTRLSITFGFSSPVGKNTRSAESFPSHSSDPNKRIVTEDNFHRRGLDAIPAIFKTGGQIGYQLNPHVDLKLPLFLNLGLNNIDYQGYELHPEVSFSFKPNATSPKQTGFNLAASIEVRYGDVQVNKLYYQVKPSEAILGRAAYSAQAGELSRSYSLALRYQYPFNYGNSIRFFLAFIRRDYSHSANTQSPLHVVNDNTIIATGFSYYFYSSKQTVTR